jgi:flagellar biosynthesis/type III secretory pathway M-ring protein FliF/YscJ
VADAAFCELIAEDLGVKHTTAKTAFLGEPKVRAIRVTEWALRHQPDDAERRARMILAWAKKRKAGAFREDQGDDTSLAEIFDRERERFERLAETLARMWVEHPEGLAEAIRALEEQRNGNGRS